MSEVVLTAGGREYSGWKSIRIVRGMEQIAGTFELSVTERWAGQVAARAILPGEKCTVAVAGEVVITGYVDDLTPSYTATDHAVTVAGRDATGDLVDCSAIHAGGEWKDRNLTQIAADLCRPFGIQVTAATAVGAPFSRFALQEGESVFECLERAARIRGVLLVSDGKGGLLITRASTQRIATPLVLGDNLKAGRATLSWRDRHSRITVKGQAAGGDFSTAEQNTQPTATATDPAISRYRPLIVIGEEQGDAGKLGDRARWEAAVRMGRGSRATVTVQDWRHAAGLWQPNRLAPVRDAWLGLDRDMLIVQASFVVDEEGKRCELELCRPEAFRLLALPEPTEAAGW